MSVVGAPPGCKPLSAAATVLFRSHKPKNAARNSARISTCGEGGGDHDEPKADGTLYGLPRDCKSQRICDTLHANVYEPCVHRSCPMNGKLIAAACSPSPTASSRGDGGACVACFSSWAGRSMPA